MNLTEPLAIPIPEQSTPSTATGFADLDLTTVGDVTVPDPRMKLRDINVFYGKKQAVFDVSLDIGSNSVVSMIGPSGCGKTTLLRCLNRMNDTIDGCRVEGRVEMDGKNVYARKVDPVPPRGFTDPATALPGSRSHRPGGNRPHLAGAGRPARRGQGPAGSARHRAVRRPAAAPVHRARHRGQPRSDPDGRALLGTGSDCHRQD